MSCVNGKCSCGSSCNCRSFEVEPTMATFVLADATHKGSFGGGSSEMAAAENGGCSCNTCNCGTSCGCSCCSC